MSAGRAAATHSTSGKRCLQGKAPQAAAAHPSLKKKRNPAPRRDLTDDVLFILEEEIEVSTPWLPSPSRELAPAMPCPVLLPPLRCPRAVQTLPPAAAEQTAPTCSWKRLAEALLPLSDVLRRQKHAQCPPQPRSSTFWVLEASCCSPATRLGGERTKLPSQQQVGEAWLRSQSGSRQSHRAWRAAGLCCVPHSEVIQQGLYAPENRWTAPEG